mmetsp:Transcript_8047/g.9176  ORF Transcript_8047/g.9176 Transcript_8047/m.9176 type:complete len:188 (+) Transcript_8047:395-958(+)
MQETLQKKAWKYLIDSDPKPVIKKKKIVKKVIMLGETQKIKRNYFVSPKSPQPYETGKLDIFHNKTPQSKIVMQTPQIKILNFETKKGGERSIFLTGNQTAKNSPRTSKSKQTRGSLNPLNLSFSSKLKGNLAVFNQKRKSNFDEKLNSGRKNLCNSSFESHQGSNSYTKRKMFFKVQQDIRSLVKD